MWPSGRTASWGRFGVDGRPYTSASLTIRLNGSVFWGKQNWAHCDIEVNYPVL